MREAITRRTIKDMNEDELRLIVKRLRKQKRRLSEQLDKVRRNPDYFEIEGNRGGSFIRLSRVYVDDHRRIKEGMVHLEVGETCVVTVQQDISVAGLAAILTSAKDVGFQSIVDEYTRQSGGTPRIDVNRDLSPNEVKK